MVLVELHLLQGKVIMVAVVQLTLLHFVLVAAVVALEQREVIRQDPRPVVKVVTAFNLVYQDQQHTMQVGVLVHGGREQTQRRVSAAAAHKL